jgi:DNA-binding response OmpR family regulator
MKKVLIVDDDESFLHSLIDGFKAYEDKFAITTASDGVEAVAALGEHKVSLVLTDLKMPRMDGFKLIAHLNNNYSEIPVIVMTAFGTPDMEDNLRDMGTFQYIEKPIDFGELVEKIIKGLDGSSKGYITGISLSSFLQLLELDKKSCTLTILAGNKKGIMYIRDGNLLDASALNLQGSEAAYTIVSWKNVAIEIETNCSVTEENIKETLSFILLEETRRKDESNAAKSPVSGTDEAGTGSLDSLNMEDLGLDLSAKSSPQPAAASQNAQASPQSGPAATNPALAQFIATLNSFPEIISSTISTKDGNVLHQTGEPNNTTANFITYVAVAAEQIEIAIGASGRQYSIFTLTDDSKLLVLCSQDVIVGLKVGSSVFPEPIADGLRPVLSRINLST